MVSTLGTGTCKTCRPRVRRDGTATENFERYTAIENFKSYQLFLQIVPSYKSSSSRPKNRRSVFSTNFRKNFEIHLFNIEDIDLGSPNLHTIEIFVCLFQSMAALIFEFRSFRSITTIATPGGIIRPLPRPNKGGRTTKKK